MNLRTLHLFTGGGGAVLAGHLLGHRPVAFCEIEPACRTLLKKRYPHVPCFDDITTLTGDMVREAVGEIDHLEGGSPCQGVSVAGKNAGFHDDARSSLIWHQLRLTKELRPRYMSWENVPGALTGENRAAFDAFLFELTQAGYGGAWCILSAAQVGAPHQRKRVWLLARRFTPGGFRQICTKHMPAWPHPASGYAWPTANAADAKLAGYDLHHARRVQIPGEARPFNYLPYAACEAEIAKAWPTADASAANSGESVVTREARRQRIAAEGKNGNGTGTPLSIAAQQGELADAAEKPFATPCAMDHMDPRSPEAMVHHLGVQRPGRSGSGNLREQVHPVLELWATARVSGAGTEDFVRDDGKLRDDLQTMVIMAECVSPSPSATGPTIKASDATNGGPNQRDAAGNLYLPGAVAHAEAAASSEWARPTPTASFSESNGALAWATRALRQKERNGSATGNGAGPNLGEAVAIQNEGFIQGADETQLAFAARIVRESSSVSATGPTPTVQDGENAAGVSQFERNTLPLNAEVFRELVRSMTAEQVRAIIGDRRLNPDWVCNLMGWPIGWCDLTVDKPRVPTAANGAYIFPAGRWVAQKPHEPARITSVKARSPEAKARNAQLKMLGNGKVPLCEAVAFRILFSALR